MRIDLVQPAAIFLMFCRSDCKSILKVLSLSTVMQFSTDLALMNTNHNVLKLMTQHAQMMTEVYLDVQTAVRGNF